jgi:uncharacterized protein (TIGR03000 family)
MYTIVLATLLSTGNTAPAADIYEDIRDLKKTVEEIKTNQTQFRMDELKSTIADLRQRLMDEKLDELRREIWDLKLEETGREPPPVLPVMPHPASSSEPRALLQLRLPAGASLVANDKEIALPSPNAAFVTPPLEPGKDYYYDCKVTVTRDGKPVTRVKRVTVRAGTLARLDYDAMESPPGR